MTADAFTNWLAAMKAACLARSDAECGRLLGITPRQVLNIKANGGTLQTALACRALLRNLKPYA